MERLPTLVTLRDLRAGDLAWDPNGTDESLLLMTRRGAKSHWWYTTGVMMQASTTIAADGTARHSWAYEDADPNQILVLVGRNIKPVGASVMAAWSATKSAAYQMVEERSPIDDSGDPRNLATLSASAARSSWS